MTMAIAQSRAVSSAAQEEATALLHLIIHTRDSNPLRQWARWTTSLTANRWSTPWNNSNQSKLKISEGTITKAQPRKSLRDTKETTGVWLMSLSISKEKIAQISDLSEPVVHQLNSIIWEIRHLKQELARVHGKDLEATPVVMKGSTHLWTIWVKIS